MTQPDNAANREAPEHLPIDVVEWLTDTYTPEGVRAWIEHYRNGDQDKRAKLIRLARTPDGGT